MTETIHHIDLEVINELGLHARVAARIAEIVQKFDCEVVLCKNEIQAEADSVLSLLSLDAPQGTVLKIQARGLQAIEALASLEQLFKNKFGEV